MSTIDDVLDQITKGEIEEGYIPCTDAKNWESVRVQTFNRKRKLPEKVQKELTIAKFTAPDGELFIRVYKKPTCAFMVMDPETGKLVPFKPNFDPTSNHALQRQLELMKADGRSEEELEEVLQGAKAQWEEENGKN